MASGMVETSSQESSQQPQQAGAGRSKLVQRLRGASNNLPQFLNDLLSTMASVVVGTEAAGFLVERKHFRSGWTRHEGGLHAAGVMIDAGRQCGFGNRDRRNQGESEQAGGQIKRSRIRIS